MLTIVMKVKLAPPKMMIRTHSPSIDYQYTNNAQDMAVMMPE